MELIAIPRPPEIDDNNLFARLSPQTAQKLHELALRCTHHVADNDFLLASSSDIIEFLPLEITFKTKNEITTIYASYNGGSPAPTSLMVTPYQNGNMNDTIELSRDLDQSLKHIFNSSSEPVVVSVRSIPYVPVAKQVTFEPLSTSDWEMIEMEASVLEDGGLLNQVTIVYPGQILPLRLIPPKKNKLSRRVEAAAWVKVIGDGLSDDEIDTDGDSNSSSNTVDANAESNYSVKCYRLMAETEVVVIPKSRIRDPKSDTSTQIDDVPLNLPSRPLRVQLTTLDYPETKSEFVGSHLPTPKIGYICIHPLTAMDIPGYQQCCNNEASLRTIIIRKAGSPYKTISKYNADSKEDYCCPTIATICFDDSVIVGHIALHPFMRYQLDAHLFKSWLTVQLLPDLIVERSVSNLHDAIYGKREEITIKQVSVNVKKTSRLPWMISDECDNMSNRIETTMCVECENSITNKSYNRLEEHSNSVFFGRGSLISAELLKIFGVAVSGRMNSMYRLEFSSFTSEQNNELGPIVRGSDLNELMSFQYKSECSNYEVVANVQSSSDQASENYSESINILDEYTLCLSVPYLNSIGIADVESHMISSASEIYNGDVDQMFIGIVGSKGSGKTHYAMKIASILSLTRQCAVIYLNCMKLQSSPQSTLISILQEIQRAFDEAMLRQPSVLIFDDLDYLIPNIESVHHSDGSIQHQTNNPILVGQIKVIVDHFILLSNMNLIRRGIVCLCSYKDNSSISTKFKELMHSAVEIPLFNVQQRTKFFHQHLLGQTDKPQGIPHVVSRLGRLTDGYRPRDLKLIAQRICNALELQNMCRSTENFISSENVSILDVNIDNILRDFVPISQQSLEISRNNDVVKWESIGGLFRAKKILHDIVIHPMKFRKVYSNAPTKLPTGLLIYGYPGCGKSFIVPSLAKISNLNLITCRGPELLDRYIGASEAKVRQLFARAEAVAPALLFFDEFDALAPRRGSDHTGVTDRVVNQLLTLLDGAERNVKSQIFVVAATSRPDKIDNALLRPGRLERHVFVGYPESQSEWNSLFSSMLITRNLDEEIERLKHEDLYSIFCEGLNHAKEFCASDLKAVLDTAHLTAVHEILDKKLTNPERSDHVVIKKPHLLDAFKRTRPSLLPSDKLKFQKFFRPFMPGEVKVDLEWISSLPKNGELNDATTYADIKLKTSLR